jgi:hypothetical protein
MDTEAPTACTRQFNYSFFHADGGTGTRWQLQALLNCGEERRYLSGTKARQ